jgi:CRP/FNR family transcriptional regulator, cyclic AMP receptor protein
VKVAWSARLVVSALQEQYRRQRWSVSRNVRCFKPFTPELSEKLTALLLARNIDLEEDLCDQLFNHSEKRLARVLLKLARFGQHDATPATKMPRVSHEALAEMVGTTRSRVTHFMNKFRTLGLIDYNGEITVRAELLTDVVLHD